MWEDMHVIFPLYEKVEGCPPPNCAHAPNPYIGEVLNMLHAF